MQWHPTQALLVSGSKDNLVKFWDPRSGVDLGTFHGHKNTVQSVRWNPDGHIVATASRDQSIKLYDIRAMAELYTLKGHSKEVCTVEWHPIHHDLLVSGGSDGSILHWSLRSSIPESPIHAMASAHESNVWSLQWHPLGHLLASGSNDHTTRFWSRSRPGEQIEPEHGALSSTDRTDGEEEVIPGLSKHAEDVPDVAPSLGASGAWARPARRTRRGPGGW